MTRARILLIALLASSLAACNAEDPLQPESFDVARTYGQWKLAAEEGSCAPRQIQMSFSRFSTPDPTLAHITGSWFVDDGTPPESTPIVGRIDRVTGEATFEMHPQRDILLTGVFFTHDEFIGGWRDATTDCRARYRGLKID